MNDHLTIEKVVYSIYGIIVMAKKNFLLWLWKKNMAFARHIGIFIYNIINFYFDIIFRLGARINKILIFF